MLVMLRKYVGVLFQACFSLVGRVRSEGAIHRVGVGLGHVRRIAPVVPLVIYSFKRMDRSMALTSLVRVPREI